MIQFYVQIVLEFMNCHFRNDNVAIKVSNCCSSSFRKWHYFRVKTAPLWTLISTTSDSYNVYLNCFSKDVTFSVEKPQEFSRPKQ